MIDIWSKAYEGIKRKLEETEYNPFVCRIPPQKSTFPLVVIQEITNQNSDVATAGIEGVDVIGLEIDVFISPKAATEEKILSQDKEISYVIDEYMHSVGFFRMSSVVAPNIDSTIFRRNMRYTANVSTRTGKIFR